MRKWLIAFSVAFLLILVLGGGLIWLRSGPRATAPTVDPVITWNAAHAHLADNAADLYERAFAQLNEREPNFEGFRFWKDPVPAEATAWVAQNAAALDYARQAARRTECWFPLGRSSDGQVMMLQGPPQMRMLAKLCRWRAAIAAERRDRHALAESVLLADRIGRHAACTPVMVDALVGLACQNLAQSGVLQPLCWPELSAADRAAYLEQIAPVFEPPADLSTALAGEQESAVWQAMAEVRSSTFSR